MEVVTVLKQNGKKEDMDVSTLPEGNKLEYFAAKQFLEIYNRDSQSAFSITLLQDAPDVVCAAPGNEPLYIEVATIFDLPTDAPKILGRAEGLGGAREIGEAIRQINEVIRSKVAKRYGVDNCILLLRHGVPIFSGKDFRQRMENFVIPTTHRFDEIFLLAFREENGMMHLGQDLVRLFPGD